jgi:molybdopterin converting factor small subunit
MYMYPRLTVYRVEISSTLRRFIESLGEDILYAYDRRLVGVIVNGKPMWPSAELKPGDDVTIFPIMTGG